MLIAFLSLLQVDEIMINYSYCRQYPNPVYLVPELYDYQLSDKTVNITEMEPPAYHYSNESTFLNPNWGNPNQLTVPRCILDFTVPTTMKGPVYMYYRLTNFYQNHRQYIKNFDSKIKKQLDLCTVLASDIMGHKSCPLSAGDLDLDATAWIPKELPKLPLDGNIRISDQDNNTVTCIHLSFKLQ
ncbi:hypothetical protein RMATCC62417_17119 [Rhizopus microsporus]|nr:hypothetical protein RMATCC62417_17119 [Rhizopus microsporus]